MDPTQRPSILVEAEKAQDKKVKKLLSECPTKPRSTLFHYFTIKLMKGKAGKLPRNYGRAAKLLGYFIVPETWWPLIRPEMHACSGLSVLANILRGQKPSWLTPYYLIEIVGELVKLNRCQKRKINDQLQLTRIAKALMDLLAEECNIIYDKIFIICFSVYITAIDDEIQADAFSNLNKLRCLEQCGEDITSLYDKYVHEILSNISSQASTWTLASADCRMLQAVMQSTEGCTLSVQGDFGAILTEIVPLATSLVDDNFHLAGQHSLPVLRYLALLAREKGCFTPDILNKTYSVVLKLLNDRNGEVRTFALQTLCAFFNKLPSECDSVTCNAHIDALYGDIMDCLRYGDESLRNKLVDALLDLSCMNSELLKRKVHEKIHMYRNNSCYIKLIAH